MTFGFEAIIMFSLKSYSYYPMILRQLPLDDMVLGNLFSQFSITSSVILITVFNLKYYWYFIFAGIYSIIEELFISLGIYSHHWYRTWMTFSGFILLCWIAKKIYKSIPSDIKPVLLYTYVFFSFFNLYLITLSWIFKVSGIIDFNMGILPDSMRSYTLLAVSNMLIITIPCMVIYFSGLKLRWKAIVIVVLYFTVFIEYKMKLLLIKQGWFLIYTTIEIFATYFYVMMLDRLFRGEKHKRFV